jgi:DNA-binding HxlR family transcriptional regulator
MCPVARALDVVGERWSLLIVRELLLGPKRYKDLLAALPSMGTTRLAARLKALEADGVVVKRVLPPPGDVQAYLLTPSGERLRPVVALLAAWGSEQPLHEGIDPATARPELLAQGLADLSPPEASAGRSEVYQFQVGGDTFHVDVEDGTARARSGPSPRRPAATVTSDLATFDSLARGELTLAEAIEGGQATGDGEGAVLDRVFNVLSYRPSEPASGARRASRG